MKRGRGAPVSIAVGGGKGGVGKSVFSANLAIAIARFGFRTVLVDGDLGGANLHILFGIDRPGPTMQALIEKRIESLEEAAVPTQVGGLFLVPGSGAVPGAANLPHAQKLKLLRHIQALHADVLVIDCGAGISFNVLDFYELADHRLVVATPQLTSLQNAYAFLKGAVHRFMRQRALTVKERDLVTLATPGKPTDRVGDMIARIELEDVAFARELERTLSTFGAGIVGNELEQGSQENAFRGLSRMTRDFLSVDAPVLGILPRSARIHDSVTRRRPFSLDMRASTEIRVVERVAEEILERDVESIREGRRRPSIPPARMPNVPADPADAQVLPGPIGNYIRRHDRFAVDWQGFLHTGKGDVEIRVIDVSAGGALVAADHPLAPPNATALTIVHGDAVTTVDVEVRHLSQNRCGLEFVGDGAAHIYERLAKAAGQRIEQVIPRAGHGGR